MNAIKKLLLTLFFFSLGYCISCHAAVGDTFDSIIDDGTASGTVLKCTILDEDAKTVSVASNGNPSVTVIIPATVKNEDTGIEYTVVKLAPDAFKSSRLVRITLPATVTEIGSGAFNKCANFLELIWNPDSEHITIGSNAFGDTAISSITLPEGIKSIPSGCFYYCTRLTSVTLPSTVITLESQAFAGCSALINITLPEGVESLSSNCFNYCRKLTSIQLPSTLKTLGSFAFRECNALTNVNLPDGLTKIESSAFYKCTSLMTLKLTPSLNSVGESAFSGCSKLTDINIPPLVTTIPKYCFQNCTSLASLDIPSTVTAIADQAFSGCTVLTDIRIPDSVTEANFGTKVFEKCKMRSLDIFPSNFTSMGVQTFDNSTFTEIVLPPNIRTISGITNCKQLTSVISPENAIATTIGASAFINCTALKTVHLPESLLTIGNQAFSGCTALTNIRIPDSVTEANFGTKVFEKCKMRSLDIFPSNFTSMGVQTFDNSTFTEIVLPPNIRTISGITNCKQLTSVIFPENCIATTIGASAFINCTALPSISISKPVKSIETLAFQGCSALKSVDLPNTLTSIGSRAFSKCTALGSIQIPNSVLQANFGSAVFEECNGFTNIDGIFPENFTSCGTSTFIRCTGITSATFPEHMTEANGFYQCTNLTEIKLHNRINTIADNAFIGCTKLVSVDLLNSVTTIGSQAFRDCSALANVRFSNSITTIGTYAFFGCTKLTDVVLSPSITKIGTCAFYGCTAMTRLYLGPQVSSIDANAFYNAPLTDGVYICAQTVPTIQTSTFNKFTGTLYFQNETDSSGKTTLSKYQANTYWKKFTKMEELDKPTGMTIGWDMDKEMEGAQEVSAHAPAFAPNSGTQYNTYDHIYATPGETLQRTATLEREDEDEGNNDNTKFIPYVFWHSDAPEKVYVEHDGTIDIRQYPEMMKPVTLTAQSLYANGPTHTITVDNYHMTGVEEVFIDDDSEELNPNTPARIYTIDGLPAGTSLDGLAPGIYIVVQGTKKVKINIR